MELDDLERPAWKIRGTFSVSILQWWLAGGSLVEREARCIPLAGILKEKVGIAGCTQEGRACAGALLAGRVSQRSAGHCLPHVAAK